MKRLIFFFFLVIIGATQTFAQVLTMTAHDSLWLPHLRYAEGRLAALGNDVVFCKEEKVRDSSLQLFQRTLDSTLQIPGAYFYPFDSVRNLSKLRPSDNAFRLLTYTFRFDNDSFIFFGLVWMNPQKGGMVYKLSDSSHLYYKKEPVTKVLTPINWYGALYYQMHDYEYKKQRYYILIGWDGFTRTSSKKLVDVMWFDRQGKIKFGAPIFSMVNNRRAYNRVVWEFADDAVMALRYEKRKNIITFENLQPPDSNSIKLKHLYLPDGTYDYFRYKKGIWYKNEMLFDDMRNPIED